MMERSPELAQALGVLPTVEADRPAGRRQPLRGRDRQARGRREPALRHRRRIPRARYRRPLFDTFRTGMGARQQPLLFVITTAGDNTAGPCKLLQGDVCNILEGRQRAR
jgi:hypothetical protein